MNTDMIAFEAEMRRLRGAYIFDIAPAIEMYRALLTRVEVLDVAFTNSHQLNESLGDENRAALARVAELEAASDAQWRPVTEKPPEPPDGETSEYLTWNDFVGFTVRRYHDGQFHSAFRKQPTHWRPLPPAPQETE